MLFFYLVILALSLLLLFNVVYIDIKIHIFLHFSMPLLIIRKCDMLATAPTIHQNSIKVNVHNHTAFTNDKNICTVESDRNSPDVKNVEKNNKEN